jgi:TRAP-type C4-dicarboxylate transport system substrate-binding protein
MQTVVLPIWMNLDKWNELPKDLQEIIRSVAKDRNLFMDILNDQEADRKKILKEAQEEHGVKLYAFPEEDAKKIRGLIQPAWDFYVTNCEKQGYGDEARKIRSILSERFDKAEKK